MASGAFTTSDGEKNRLLDQLVNDVEAAARYAGCYPVQLGVAPAPSGVVWIPPKPRSADGGER